ncbi:hypothetical protein BgiMline_022257, partial [Biomphalaria glabrata]
TTVTSDLDEVVICPPLRLELHYSTFSQGVSRSFVVTEKNIGAQVIGAQVIGAQVIGAQVI